MPFPSPHPFCMILGMWRTCNLQSAEAAQVVQLLLDGTSIHAMARQFAMLPSAASRVWRRCQETDQCTKLIGPVEEQQPSRKAIICTFLQVRGAVGSFVGVCACDLPMAVVCQRTLKSTDLLAGSRWACVTDRRCWEKNTVLTSLGLGQWGPEGRRGPYGPSCVGQCCLDCWRDPRTHCQPICWYSLPWIPSGALQSPALSESGTVLFRYNTSILALSISSYWYRSNISTLDYTYLCSFRKAAQSVITQTG